MEYTAPTLQVVGAAQNVVLGCQCGLIAEQTSSAVLEVLGLDD